MITISTRTFCYDYNGINKIEVEKNKKSFKFFGTNMKKAIKNVARAMKNIALDKTDHWDIIDIKNT